MSAVAPTLVREGSRAERGILRDAPLLGVALFVASESIFFLAVIAAYVAYRDSGVAEARRHLDVGRTVVFSLFLFASSGTVTAATRTRQSRWLLATGALGAVFLAGQATEYARLLSEGIAPGAQLFGTTFYTLTGLHGLHLLGGLAALATLAVCARASRGRVGAIAWEGVGLYWHFVDAVWVAVLTVVYLWTLL